MGTKPGNPGSSFRPDGSVRGSLEALSQSSKRRQDSHIKALQVRIENAMFDSSPDYKYFIAVTLEDGIPSGDHVSSFKLTQSPFLDFKEKKDRHLWKEYQSYLQCQPIQLPY
jgi:hypothetical protein